MSSFGAPIMNNGYYDVPIDNQYSNQPMPRNRQTAMTSYQVNKNINKTINDNEGNYLIYNEPTIPSPSLYYETDQSMSGYYQDPMYLSSDAGMPLMKKKELSYNDLNNKPFIESFDNNNTPLIGRGGYVGGGTGHTLGPGRNIGTGYLNPQFIQNVNRNYWGYNDPGYTNYYFVPQPLPIVQPPPKIVYNNYNNDNDDNNYDSDDEVEIVSLKEDIKKITKQAKQTKQIKQTKQSKQTKQNKKLKENKDAKKKIDNKTLWNVIILLIFIIFCFIMKYLYDYKIIRINFKK